MSTLPKVIPTYSLWPYSNSSYSCDHYLIIYPFHLDWLTDSVPFNNVSPTQVENLFILGIAFSHILGHCMAMVNAQRMFMKWINEQTNVSSLLINPVSKCCLSEWINKNHYTHLSMASVFKYPSYAFYLNCSIWSLLGSLGFLCPEFVPMVNHLNFFDIFDLVPFTQK